MVRMRRRSSYGSEIRVNNSLPIRICVSWYRVCFLLLFLYAALVVYVFRLITSSNNKSQKSVLALSRSLNHFPSLASHERSKGRDDHLVDQQAELGSTVGLVNSEHAERVKQLEQEIRKLQDGSFASYRSCRWRAGNVYSSDPACPVGATQVIYYNPHSEPRILCDKTIPPHSHLLFERTCSEPARLFPVIPDLSGRGLPPVKTCFNECNDRQPAKTFDDCDIPCTHTGSNSIISRRYIDGTDWSVVFSMEGPQYYEDLRIKKDNYKTNTFYSTTSYESDIPLPYFSWAEYDIQSPPLKYDDAIKAAVFLARNCNSLTHREDIIRKLEESSFRVDSLSSCLRNAKPPKGVDLANKVQVMQHYLFYLAFENQNEPDYVTEKLWGPMVAGTVPVYFGAPNVKDHAPNHSIIVVDDFASIDDLAAYLNKVANDKALYEEYQAWRTRPLPPHFHARYDFTKVHSTCRTCRWAHAKLYGLGWNHSTQSLVELNIPRKVCFDERGLVHKPFREEWLTDTGGSLTTTSRNGVAAVSCGKVPWSGTSRLVVPDQIRRTVYEQDGVVDLHVESLAAAVDDFVLRLYMQVDEFSTFTLMSDGHARVQDQRTRYTVIPTSGDTNITYTRPEHINIAVQACHLPLRIRIIAENLDTFHKDASEEESFYGLRMSKDFWMPMEGFSKM